MYRISIPKKVEKRIKRFPLEYLERIRTAIASLAYEPYAGKKLEGRYADCYSIRVWPYRIIYMVKDKELIVQVIEVEHRGGAYRK